MFLYSSFDQRTVPRMASNRLSLVVMSILIVSNPSFSQEFHYSNITCGQTISGYMPPNHVFVYYFTPVPGLMTFHTCDSPTDYYTTIEVGKSSGGTFATSYYGGCSRFKLANLSWTYDPYDNMYLPTDYFYVLLESAYATQESGSGYFALTMQCNSDYTPTSQPSPAPTYSPLPRGNYYGQTLIARGFNIFMAEASGSPILNVLYTANNTELYTFEGSTCSYASLQFDNRFTSFTAFAESDSASVAVDYSAGETYGGGGSLSTTRTQTRSYSESGGLFIYDLKLSCIAARANLVNFNKLHWSANFVESLRTLPQSYSTGDDLENYIEFWESYGTHIYKSAEFGGSIRGAIVASSCGVEESFASTTEYEACLNARYKGVEVEGCYGESDSLSSLSAVDTTLKHVYIDVFGGDSSTYSKIFNDFTGGSKEQDFNAWISGLRQNPYIIGGNVDEIHDAILQAVALGGHLLNEYQISHPVSDETFVAIANALKSAYKDYAQQVATEYNFFSDAECSVQCDDGFPANVEQCTCTGCATAEECCFGNASDSMQTHSNVFALYFLLLSVLLSCLITC